MRGEARPHRRLFLSFGAGIIGTIATDLETAIVLIIARIDDQIAQCEARMLTAIRLEELQQQTVDKLIELYQSKWEREEALRSSCANNTQA